MKKLSDIYRYKYNEISPLDYYSRYCMMSDYYVNEEFNIFMHMKERNYTWSGYTYCENEYGSIEISPHIDTCIGEYFFERKTLSANTYNLRCGPSKLSDFYKG